MITTLKSSFANSLESDIFELNDMNEFVVLNFSFEMLNERQIGRKLSYKMRKTTTELYSAHFEEDNTALSDYDYKRACEYAKDISKFPLYYVDRPGTTDEIRDTIKHFQNKFPDKWLVVILDHTLLTKGKLGSSEREVLADLQKVFMETKKIGTTTIIQLSQMNREIESVDRLNNPSMHYPMRRDLFGSESLYQASDYVIVLHRPEILGITAYGPSRLPVKNLIYMHFTKMREGEPKILTFSNNLKYNSIEEVSLETIKTSETNE